MIQTIPKQIINKRPWLHDQVNPTEIIAKRQAEDDIFTKKCREIFQQVYPELAPDHNDWFIYIEPNSGEYFIDAIRDVARQKAKQKHPEAVLMAMRLNETGTVGRI